MVCGSGCCGPPKEDTALAAQGAQGAPVTSSGERLNQAPVSDPESPARESLEIRPVERADDPTPNITVRNQAGVDFAPGNEPNPSLIASSSPANVATEDACDEDACEEDCCASPPSEPLGHSKSDMCENGCCATDIEEPRVGQVDICGVDACCSTKASTANEKNECCAVELESSNNDCKDACCSDNSSDKQKIQPAPDCCAEKASPCCSTSCIDRIALRECLTGDHSDSCCGSDQGKEGNEACSTHMRRAYDRYQAQLEAIGCICRALISLGKESCCTLPVSARGKRVRSQVSVGSRTGSKTSLVSMSSKKMGCAKSCCRPKVKSSEKQGCSKECCQVPDIVSTSVEACADSCCDVEDASPSPKRQGQLQTSETTGDLEKRGLSGKERVVLAISGMTCTGCETKLQRTLATLPAISNLKTSLVLSRAEFDVDLGMFSVSEAMKHLERTTEFKCERLTSHGSCLDLTCDNARDMVARKWPPTGVTSVRAVDRKTIRVEFDPHVVGARDLVEKGWDTPMNLAPPQPDQALNAGAKHVRNVGLSTLFSIIFTIPVLIMAWAPLPEHEIAYGSASLALATLVQVFVAGPFYPKALKAMVFSRVIEMDLLIVLSTSTAYIFSVVSFAYLATGQPLPTGEFFETSTLLITLIMVGRYLAALARQKAVESISIRSLQSSSATLDHDCTTKQIDSRLLQFGDIFTVSPDSVVPTDGTVLSGNSEVDESMMTGEATPVEKGIGSTVIAGSINGPGTLKVRLTRLPDDNTISTIAGMVDEAKLSKPKLQEIADRVAAYFVPVVVALTVITFSIWVAVGVQSQKKSGSDAVIQAVTYGITVLIVSCPCAIGLAVPMVIVIATGIAAERGVIFKSSSSIELASKTSHVVFDKTGTLTQGKLLVTREEYLTDDIDSARSLLLALVEHVKHPVSAAVASHLKGLGVAATSSVETTVLAGKGVQGKHLNSTISAGNSRWLSLSSNVHVQSIQSQGQTAFCFVVDDAPVAIFGLQDSLRSDALATISKLKAANVTIHVLSGDDDKPVRAVGRLLGISDANVRSCCTPAEKQGYIRDLLATGSSQQTKAKVPVVIFCGDGTNDAAALAQATIGVHINEGTDIAKSAADVVLVRPNLTGILTVIEISKKATRRIGFNFGWSFVYNLFAVLLASGAFVNARIPPAYAGLGELVSVLPVIAAAILMRWTKV